MHPTKPPMLLCLDPGTKDMGVALLEGHDLLDYRVKTFRNGRKPHELLGQARSVMVRLLFEMRPDVVVMEKPFFAQTRRSALLTFLVQELRGRVLRKQVLLHEYEPREVKEILLGNPKGTKREIASYIAQRFPELRQRLHPGDFWRERYWSHVFDAVALGLTELARRERQTQSPARDMI